MSRYLTLKDCAKILYDLYKDTINNCNVKEVKISPEITEELKQKYHNCDITDEEKWAYGHRLLYLSDEPYLARLSSIRERKVPKQTFFLAVAIPVYRICVNLDPVVFSEKVMQFGLENGFYKGIKYNKCKSIQTELEEREWFWEEGESICVKDAEIIVKNIKDFLASRNC